MTRNGSCYKAKTAEEREINEQCNFRILNSIT